MIKNDRHFAIVRGRVERLRRVQDDLLEKLTRTRTSRDRVELELAAVRAEIRRMQLELDDYEALKSGHAQVGRIERLEDLPRVLIRGRIAAGLTHAELAKKLGVHAQQIQRYEATDYESASLSRLIEIARALDLEVGPSPRQVISTSAPQILQALRSVGIDRGFLARRFGVIEDDEKAAATALGLASHVFRVRPDDIMAGDLSTLEAMAGPVAYKKVSRSSHTRATALVAYGNYLSQIVANAVPAMPVSAPIDATRMHARISQDGSRVTFATALSAVWEAGIPVVPINEGGGFQAAYWRHGDRYVIVINSGHQVPALWLFYLLHEVGHIGDIASDGLVETDPGHDDAAGSQRERRANEFATGAIFGGRSAELAELAIERSQGQLGLLQRTVRWVARNNDVDVGALALNVAFRLAERGRQWWPAAIALQEPDGDPWRQARDTLVEQLDWSALAPLDADLLMRALDYPSEATARVGTEP